MTDWLKSPYYKDLPAKPPATSIVDWDLAQQIRQDTEAYTKFTAATPDYGYTNPGEYIRNLISYAEGLANNANSAAARFLETAGFPYMPAGWDPVTAAIKAATTVFTILQGIAVNAGDEKTNNVYDAWVNHLGQYYGGHLPAAPVSPSPSFNPLTGPSAGPGGILGGGAK